ncbi:VanZ family protein [Psychrobacillus sp. MER TA 171]|uniref:VanZ family protein n=1 Tax=Psychrobacillus sp. MER TA 171 TaxID=2939577 RepID=UPI00203DD3CD|nr:VanZ family protein [Psychrobacillus sp. MER TA 171]MCM3356618.1 VanZ family protein [Psychrobacillus sp. MER TA 171]
MRKIFLFGVVIIWMGIIFYLSQQPASVSSQLSSNVAHTIKQAANVVAPETNIIKDDYYIVIRKQAHFLVYFILGILLMQYLKSTRLNLLPSMAFSLVICVVFAIADETLQLFALGRGAQVRDVFIDTVGASIGIIGYVLLSKIRVFISRLNSSN